MPDIFDPGGLTDWWDVPADYFSGGGMVDYSHLGGGGLNTDFGNLGGTPSTTGYGDFFTDPGNMGSSGEDQWFYDTQTGQVVTGPQAQQIDPSFDWQNAAKMAIGGATALGGLGALGLGIGSLFGGNDPKNQTTNQTSTGGRAPMTPEMMSLLGSGGGVGGPGAPGAPGGAGGGGTGLLGLSNMMIQNLMGSGQGGAPGSAPGLGQPAPGGWSVNGGPGQQIHEPGGSQIGQVSEMPGGLQTRGPGSIGYAGGTPNFNESTGQYAPGTGPQWQQQGGQPQNWPAVPGSGGGYLSAPSGGGQPQPFQLGAPPQMPGYEPSPPAPRYGMRETTGIQGQKMSPTLQQMGGGQPGPQGMPQQGGQPQQGGGQGLIGQQSNVLGGLQSQIPQLNPAIMQALGMQAGGMAQGYLPSLSDPQAQARIQSIYQPGFDALNYNSGLALSNAREQLQQRGFQAPDIREGPTQALTAPILAAQQLGRSQLYGQMAGAQLDLATRLPQLASQLNAQNYSTQAQPFNLGTQLAGAYNQPIQTQGQFPLSLLDILQRGQGTTQTVNTVGPQPSLTQQLGQVAPLVGAGGSLLSSAGSTLWPQQQQQVGLSNMLPQYYTSGGMYP